LKEFRLGDVLEGLAGVELFCFVRFGLSHGLHRPVDVLEARSICRRCIGLIVLCVFVFTCDVIYPDVGKCFIEASSGMLMSSRLNALMMKLLSISEAFVFRAMMVKFTNG